MNIALLAHDSKKELMVQFCLEHCSVLSRHKLFATQRTGRMAADATGLPITLYLPKSQSGAQQIRSMIEYHELDLVLFFSSTNNVVPQSEVADIGRVCDTYNIPFASNLATAEILIHAVDSGLFEAVGKKRK